MKELVTIQSELKAPKNQRNSFGGYNYRSAEDILEAVKPLLKATKCSLVVTDDIIMVGERIYVKSVATLKNEKGETEEASAFARESLAKKGMDDAQVTGSASSYARKYALNGLFCIDDNKDPDALNTSESYTAQGNTDTIEEAAKEISVAKTKEEMNAIWKKHVAKHKNWGQSGDPLFEAARKRNAEISNG